MRLAKLSEYRRMVYAEGSAPSLNTLRALINRNQIPGGEIRHGHYYVDLDANDLATKMRSDLSARQAQITNDPDMAGLF
jgi:hypothetical protein